MKRYFRNKKIILDNFIVIKLIVEEEVLPNVKDYKIIDLPILSITSHFDADQEGAMHYYQQHIKYGKASAIKDHYLILDLWSHGGTRRPKY